MSVAAAGPLVGHHNPRWEVAEQVTHALRVRHDRRIQAIGVHGSLAHDDDNQTSDIDMVVVVKSTGTGLSPRSRRVNGVIVDIGVIDADGYLRHARTLTTSWPLTADQFITMRALHDPDGWLPRLRDAHLSMLARTDEQVFATLAREVWCRAASSHMKAGRFTERHDVEAAQVVLGDARLNAALVEGLLTRTYFRHPVEAMIRTGVASAGVGELGRRLATLADELRRRGRPVDGEVTELFD